MPMRRLIFPILPAMLVMVIVNRPSAPAAAGVDDHAAQSPQPTAAAPALVDAPLDAYRLELITLAFDAASAMPLQPHIKSRARAQERVVETCLALGLPQRGLTYIEQIPDWRRGNGYADYALALAKVGAWTEAEKYLQMAQRIAATEEDWRRDMILTKAAAAYAWLGDDAQAASLEAGVVDAETGKVHRIRAQRINEDGFDALFAEINDDLVSGNFDRVRNGHDAALTLLDRFFADSSRRTQLVNSIRTAAAAMAPYIRIDVLCRLGQSAAKHADASLASESVDQAQYLVDHMEWLAADRIALLARVAGVRAAMGQAEKAQAMLIAASELYGRSRDQMENHEWADCLLPIAEARVKLDGPAAPATLAAYALAVDAGAVNSNARPRCNDLVEVCLSMATHSVQPDAELMARLRGIREGLVDPW